MDESKYSQCQPAKEKIDDMASQTNRVGAAFMEKLVFLQTIELLDNCRPL